MAAGAGWAAMFPDEVWEHVFSFLAADGDRNAVSLVCSGWYSIERRSRRRIFVGNCYAVAPAAAIRRFPNVRVVSIKGKPHFADFNLVPSYWGGRADEMPAGQQQNHPQVPAYPPPESEEEKEWVWSQIKAEARRDAESEPALASYLYATILSHPSLARLPLRSSLCPRCHRR